MSDVRSTVSNAWDRLTAKRPRPSVDEAAGAARKTAEKISKPLPDVVFPHDGLKEDRRRKAMIDALERDR